MNRLSLLSLGALGFVLVACAPAQEAPPTPTSTRPLPTLTAASTPAPTPPPQLTASPVAPTPKPTALPTVAPAATPKYGGILRAYVRESVSAWDFHKWIRGARELRALHHSVFNSIGTNASTGGAPCEADTVPDIAEKWKWVDNTTFDLSIYKGIRFHNKPPVNGREMTADDVVWSWKRILAVNPRVEFLGNELKDIVATDRYTVRFRTIKAPLPWIMNALAFSTTSNIVAKESGDYSRDPKWGHWESPEKTWIGSGPFVFGTQSSGVKVEMQRNPDYFKKGLPYLDGLVFMIIPDMSTRLAAMNAGKLDLWYAEVPIAIATSVQKRASNLQVQGCPFLNPQVVFMRTNQPPFNDVRVRRAALMAMDQEALIKSIFMGQAWPSTILPPLNPWYLKAEEFPADVRRNLQYNPEEAKRLLAEAGYPNGFDTEFIANPNFRSPYNELTEAMAAMLGQVGIRAKIRWVSLGEWDETGVTGDYKGMRAGKATDIEDPYLHLPSYHSKTPPALNKSWVADPKLDPLIDEFMLEPDEAKAKDLFKRIQYRLLEQVYQIVAPAHFDFSIAQPYVKGFAKGGNETESRWWSEVVWLDK